MALWLLVLGLVWIRNFAAIDDLTVSGITIGYISLCYACYAIPARIIGRPLSLDFGETNRASGMHEIKGGKANGRVWAQLFMGISLFMACALYLYSRRSLFGIETHEARIERSAGDLMDNRVMPLYALMSMIGVAGIYYVLAARWHWFFQFAYVGMAMSLGVFVYFALGTRYEVLLPVIMLSVAAFVIFKAKSIYSHRAVYGILAFFVGIGLIGFNSLLSLPGFRLGADNTDARVLIENGDRLTFQLFGNVPGDTQILLTVGLFDQYALQPVAYLDHYLKNNDVSPVYGAHQFSYVARRFGLSEMGDVAKARVDQLYESIGVPEGVNVWATLMREVAIDTGITFGPIVFLLFGFLTGLAKRHFYLSRGAQFIVVYLTAIMLFSPFSSLFKSNLMQAGFYGALIWYGWDVFITKHRTSPESI